MYTGWMSIFPVNRKLEDGEKAAFMAKNCQDGIDPSQRLGLVKINSTYIDWIDRRFLYRGMLNVSIVFFGVLFFVGMLGWLVWWFFDADEYHRMAILIPMPVPILAIMVFYLKILNKEFFSHIYYPIRLNRKTRKIYVFRDKRDGGILTVPWESVFFHIGRGTDMKFLRDIRGEVMDGDVVKDTFALGHCAESDRPVLEMWEFIRRYMDEGPEAVAEVPLDKYVELSVAPTLKNCLISAVGFTNATTPAKRILLSPFIGLFTVVRWLVFKTCKEPQFPPEIEAECRVEPNDPNVWPIPDSIGEFAATVPGFMERAREKARLAQTADMAAQRSRQSREHSRRSAR
ncbi:DUF6708 domain-containing protein [Burkholderia oklahomensis]|uniref:DUF6708 domain-containing protein n=1 Tax=Burkholderia oklahomensis TaxID=342113 RepID=UPI0005D93B96|nr:DUF6708 domain-containing protein [Burkholderia oklahomensis]AJX31436.1 putative exported protein [Burkholderia oklahomensis C6786]SUW54812.1 Uncharacterised protein [Burkholderia oklahomensis]